MEENIEENMEENMKEYSLKITIKNKEEQEEEQEEEQAKITDIITQSDITKLKKQFKFTYKNDALIPIVDAIHFILLCPNEGYIRIKKGDHTDKNIIQVLLKFKKSIIQLIKHKVTKQYIVTIGGIHIDNPLVCNNDYSYIDVIPEKILETPYLENISTYTQASEKNSWTLFINSHSDFYIKVPPEFNPESLDPIISAEIPKPNDDPLLIHLLYIGEIGVCNIGRNKFKNTNIFPIVKYLYEQKNYKNIQSSDLNQIILNNKDLIIQHIDRSIPIYNKELKYYTTFIEQKQGELSIY